MKELMGMLNERITTLMATQEKSPLEFDDYDLGMLRAFLATRTWVEQHQEEQKVIPLRSVSA